MALIHNGRRLYNKLQKEKKHHTPTKPQQNRQKNNPPNPSLPIARTVIRPLTGTTEIIFAFSAAAVKVQSTNVKQTILNNFTVADYKVYSREGRKTSLLLFVLLKWVISGSSIRQTTASMNHFSLLCKSIYKNNLTHSALQKEKTM